MFRKTIKDGKYVDCNHWTSKQQCLRGDWCSFKHDVNEKGPGKSRRSLSQSETRRHSKGDGKGNIEGKGQKGTSPSGRPNEPVCTCFLKGQCQKEIHMRVLAPTRKLTLHIKRWMQTEETRVYSRHGTGTMATKNLSVRTRRATQHVARGTQHTWCRSCFVS